MCARCVPLFLFVVDGRRNYAIRFGAATAWCVTRHSGMCFELLPLFHSQVSRRGCGRTAFELCRLCLSLSPLADPVGALLALDYYALLAGRPGQRALLHLWTAPLTVRAFPGTDASGASNALFTVAPGAIEATVPRRRRLSPASVRRLPSLCFSLALALLRDGQRSAPTFSSPDAAVSSCNGGGAAEAIATGWEWEAADDAAVAAEEEGVACGASGAEASTSSLKIQIESGRRKSFSSKQRASNSTASALTHTTSAADALAVSAEGGGSGRRRARAEAALCSALLQFPSVLAPLVAKARIGLGSGAHGDMPPVQPN
jgi:hypothetical protein